MPETSRSRSARSRLPYGVNRACEAVKQWADTGITRLWAIWWGIELGKAARFYGVPVLRRHPTGDIVIGDETAFRSAEWAGSIGLNRRCFLSVSRNARIIIGNGCGFSSTVIAASASIHIGDRVLCGANCTIVDNDRHPVEAVARANGEPVQAAAVVIDDDVWLGMNVVVLKGCHIGPKTVVAANSVVTRSLPGGVLAGGVPARILKDIE